MPEQESLSQVQGVGVLAQGFMRIYNLQPGRVWGFLNPAVLGLGAFESQAFIDDKRRLKRWQILA